MNYKSLDIGIIAVTIIFTFSIGYLKPHHNWDMIGYVASAFNMDGFTGQELSERTYSDVENEVRSDQFQTMTSGHYRTEVYQDSKALEQQLPFYSPRVFYVEGIRVLGNLGFSYAKSTYLISSFFAAASVLVIAIILKQLCVSVYFLPLIVLLSGLTSLARYSTPDAMVCFFSLAALSMLVAKNNIYLIIAAALPLVRTDFFILSLLLGIYGYLSGKKLMGAVSALVSIILYISVNKVMGNYGWLTIFNFTLIQIDPYPANMAISTEWHNYARPYLSAVLQLLGHVHGMIYFFAILCWFSLKRKVKSLNLSNNLALSVSLISLSFVSLHLIAFPVYFGRFFVFAAVVNLIFIIQRLHQVKEMYDFKRHLKGPC